MKTTLTLSGIWSDDAKLRRVFSWLTRIGASPASGSRPVGWYQQHQCKVIAFLEASWAREQPLRCKGNKVQAQDTAGLWLDVVSVHELYAIGATV